MTSKNEFKDLLIKAVLAGAVAAGSVILMGLKDMLQDTQKVVVSTEGVKDFMKEMENAAAQK